MNISYWNKTITVYNRYENSDGIIKYYRKVLHNCFWKETNNKISVSNVSLQSNNHIIRIPKSCDYLPPAEWLNSSDKTNKFTLQTGDIITKGDITFDIDELKDGCRLNDFLSRYRQGVTEITSVNDNTDLPNAHYLVKGE